MRSSPNGGNGIFTYSWEKQLEGSTTWQAVEGATFDYFDALEITAQFRLRRLVKSGSASSYSNIITVLLNNSLPITNNIISANQTIDEGDTVSTLTGSVPSGGSGAGSFKYRWQKKVGAGDWENINGATSLTYDPGILYETTSYRRIVRSGNAADNTSNEITINVIPA